MTDLFDLSGKTAFVTGSVRGLGYQAASGLASCGAHVIVNGRHAASLEDATARLREQGGDVEACLADVTAPPAASALLGLPPIDILVNNVGRRDRRGLDDLAPADLESLLHDHVVAAYALSREVAVDMIERGTAGRIINLSSVIAQLGRVGDAAYAVAKAGMEGMTRALAAELGRHRITVNALAPGTFATETNAALADDPAWSEWLGRRTALGRWGNPEEIAGAVVFLASDASSFVTGQTLAVDGGMTTTF